MTVSLTRLLIYGQYCSHMENAQKTLDELIATREDIKIKVEVALLPGAHTEYFMFWDLVRPNHLLFTLSKRS